MSRPRGRSVRVLLETWGDYERRRLEANGYPSASPETRAMEGDRHPAGSRPPRGVIKQRAPREWRMIQPMIEVLRSESQQHQVLATAIEDQYVLGFSVQQVRITRGWCVSKTHSRRAEAHRTIASMCGMAKAFVTT